MILAHILGDQLVFQNFHGIALEAWADHCHHRIFLQRNASHSEIENKPPNQVMFE